MSNDKYEVEVYLFTQEEPVKYITGWVDIDVNELNGLTTQGDFIKLGDNYIRKADIKQILSHKVEDDPLPPMPPMANSGNEVAPFQELENMSDKQISDKQADDINNALTKAMLKAFGGGSEPTTNIYSRDK